MRPLLALLGLVWSGLACAQPLPPLSPMMVSPGGVPSWVLPGAVVDIDCTNHRVWPPNILNSLAVARTGGASELTLAGGLVLFANNQLRNTSFGCMVEEARTNSIANSSMVGASAPSTLPTGWSQVSTATGIALTVVGVGVIDNISYIDLTVNGTPTGTGSTILSLGGPTDTAALYGQSWNASFYYNLMAGVVTNLTTSGGIQENTSGGAEIRFNASAFVVTPPTTLALANNRYNGNFSLVAPTTAFARSQIRFAMTNGQAVNATIRIGSPQLEMSPLAPEIIQGVATALAVNVGGAGYAVNDTGTILGGTCSIQPQYKVGTAAGGIVSAATVNNVGLCSVLPVAPYSTSILTGAGNGALKVTANAGTLAAISPTAWIPTTTTPASRSTEYVTIPLPAGACTAAGCSLFLFGRAYITPSSYQPLQIYAELNDGTLNNRLSAQRMGATANSQCASINSGVETDATTAVTFLSSQIKVAMFAQPGSLICNVTKAGVVTRVTATPSGLVRPTQLIIGSNGVSNFANGGINRVAVAPTSLLNN